jgi:Cu-Zn family superoxide dismutase
MTTLPRSIVSLAMFGCLACATSPRATTSTSPGAVAPADTSAAKRGAADTSTAKPGTVRDTSAATSSAVVPIGPVSSAIVHMKSSSGQDLGTLKLDNGPNGVHIRGTLNGLPPGVHGFHFHSVGKCEGNFESAGPHLSPLGKQHGLENPQGPHAGDLPNIEVNDAGVADVDRSSPRVKLDSTSPGALFDDDGTSLVIHANKDDQHTDPSGNSGARIACGVVEPGK